MSHPPLTVPQVLAAAGILAAVSMRARCRWRRDRDKGCGCATCPPGGWPR